MSRSRCSLIELYDIIIAAYVSSIRLIILILALQSSVSFTQVTIHCIQVVQIANIIMLPCTDTSYLCNMHDTCRRRHSGIAGAGLSSMPASFHTLT